MLDIRLIREDPKGIEAKLQKKDPEVSVTKVLELDQTLRTLKTKVEDLKSQRNDYSKQIGDMKRNGEDTTEVMNKVSGISEEVHQLDREIAPIQEEFDFTLSELPNIPMDDVKVSMDPLENEVIKVYGEKKEFDFAFKNHLELSENLQLFDFERGAKISGAGWPIYSGMGARLEWALLNYMLDINIKNGFTFYLLPALVRTETLHASGQLPKFAHQLFKLDDDEYKLWLIPTAEVPLNGLHSDEIIPEEEFPKKYCSYTPCFRREAGAAGKNERGLIRVHQFNKVESYCFALPHQSEEIFEQMIANAEEILQGLGLHYRNTLLVTGDMSFSSSRTVDIEVWLPGQDRYYEVSSVSNCTDYQARRSKIRFRPKGGKPDFVHTLNGSALATSRLMVGLLENNQNADGTITIPEVLRPYMGGVEKIEPPASLTRS